VRPIRIPKVALLSGTSVSGNSWGFTWFAMDQRLGYPTVLVDANYVAGGGLEGFNVLIMPSVQGAALDRLLGDGGRAALGTWVRSGGVLITGRATGWLARRAPSWRGSGCGAIPPARTAPAGAAQHPPPGVLVGDDRHPVAAAGGGAGAGDPGLRQH
jgi:hypothetical protein